MLDKLLVVDDEDAVRAVMGDIFTEAGFTVSSCESGNAAIEILNKEPIQIMFFDLMMPGMNGIELCRHVRQSNPIANIFAMTGYSTLFDLVECRNAGFDDYFLKPVDMDLLVSTALAAKKRLERWTQPEKA